MQRFELAIDGNCKVGKSTTVFVDAIEYGDNNYVKSDELEYTSKATMLLKKMSGKSIGEVVDMIRANGLDFDKVLIDRGGISFDSFVQTFAHNVLLVSFSFDFDYQDIIAYHD